MIHALELFGLLLAFVWITCCFGAALWIVWKVHAPVLPPPSAELAATGQARANAAAQAMMVDRR